MSSVRSSVKVSLKENLRYAFSKALPSQEYAHCEDVLKSTLSVRKASRFRVGEAAKAWIALIPALIFLILFMIYPIINSFLMSFLEGFTFVNGSGSSFVLTNYLAALANSRVPDPIFGFGSYAYILEDRLFLQSLGNTALIVVFSVPLTIIIALLLAVALYSIKPLQGFFQTVFFLPYVTNTIALGMVFQTIFSKGGLFNSVLGLGNMAWLDVSANRWAMFFVIIVYAIWNGLAFKILVFMSGLASIDKQYYDAARIDGAKRSTILRRITIPLLSPQVLYITITSFIGAFKSYTEVISLFGGGATDFGGTTKQEWMTIVGYIYSTMDVNPDRAAAGSMVLLVIILLITIVQMVVSKKRVHY